jgi:hypothetical protein
MACINDLKAIRTGIVIAENLFTPFLCFYKIIVI